jgi:hypothetical protein
MRSPSHPPACCAWCFWGGGAALCGLGDQPLLLQRLQMHAGWGSFPTKLQSSPMFKAIFEQSQRCYFIFQLATTVQHAARDGFFVVPPPSADCPFSAINFTTQLGPSLAVVAPDSRSQRSKHQILPQATFDWMISSVRCFQFLFLSLLTLLLFFPQQRNPGTSAACTVLMTQWKPRV